jgi:hypothetical protein
MTKIYEALENAGKERIASAEAKPTPVPVTIDLPRSLQEKLLALNQRIDALLSIEGGRIVEFVGAQPGEDTSKLVYQFAQLVAFRLNRKVLLLTGGQMQQFRNVSTDDWSPDWEEAVHDMEFTDQITYPIEESRAMPLSLMNASDLSLAAVVNAPQLQTIRDALRTRFDLILIDSPPIGTSTNAEILASVADGVVLVVEAENARWQAIKYGMAQITAQRGKILGVVLNKRRHHIPDFIYRRL